MENKINIREQMFLQRENKEIFEMAKSFAYTYIEKINDRPVFPSVKSIQQLSVFDEPLPEKPCNPKETLNLLDKYGSPSTVAQTGGRYYGFVNGSSISFALAAKWLSDIWDQNCALYVMSPIVSRLEDICEKWLKDLFELPSGTVAGLVSTTSTATMCGIAAGRNEILRRQDWDINLKGLFGDPPIRIVIGEQAHATVIKALSLLGFGKEQIKRVPVDSQGRMDADKLPLLDERTIVILQAGNVKSGSFDPFVKIGNQANNVGSWIHIDGAFGLWAAACSKKKFLTNGIEKADSWSVDAHKTLNAPYDCGIILCKNKEALTMAMQASGSYIHYSEKRDGMLFTPEMSRRARAIELWATLKYLGRSGVEEIIEGLCDRAQQFQKQLSSAGFNILNEVVFNQILVSCNTEEETNETLKNIQESGECWCGGSIWNGEPVIRISVCSWATTVKDIDRSVAAFIEAREKCHVNLKA
ncbi:MAG: aspartate aminotransferase family protein [Deltaproteobacteria bacterium]|nr:aspartate aminotransferase family protein [Deltaproteobacteria bacterium]